MEVNFGFEIVSVAGKDVPSSDQDSEPKHSEEEQKQGEQKEEKKEENDSEYSAMRQEERKKAAVLGTVGRLYEPGELDSLLANQIQSFLTKLEQALADSSKGTLVRIIMYDLLSTLIQIDNSILCQGIISREFDYILIVMPFH